MLRRPRDRVERVEDGRQEEERHEARRHEVLDVAVEDVHAGDVTARPLASATSASESGMAAQKCRPGLGDDRQVDRNDHDEHDRERDEVGRHDGQRQQLARETHLLHERCLAEQARARRSGGRLEEDPGQEARDDEQRVVLDSAEPEEDREDERVDADERERVRERPGDPEHGALVLDLELAPEEVREQLAVAVDVEPDRHSRAGTPGLGPGEPMVPPGAPSFMYTRSSQKGAAGLSPVAPKGRTRRKESCHRHDFPS